MIPVVDVSDASIGSSADSDVCEVRVARADGRVCVVRVALRRGPRGGVVASVRGARRYGAHAVVASVALVWAPGVEGASDALDGP